MSQLSLLAIISGLLTIGVRLSGLMLFAPFFGTSVIPSRVKAGLVMALPAQEAGRSTAARRRVDLGD
jgi:flagellar biosynthesis protein FliR